MTLFKISRHDRVNIICLCLTGHLLSVVSIQGLKKCLVPITLPYLVFVPYPKVFMPILLKKELFLPKNSLAVLNTNSPTIKSSISG